MDPETPGGPPVEVKLATKCLIANLGLAVFWAMLGYAHVGFPRLPWRLATGLLTALTIWIGFIALIWRGVSWARKLLLFLIACTAAPAIWSLLFAVGGNHVFGAVAPYFTTLFGATLLIYFYAAYLLLQPESAEWFWR